MQLVATTAGPSAPQSPGCTPKRSPRLGRQSGWSRDATETAELWARQDQHGGDRGRLFRSVTSAVDAETVLYPGCCVDIAPSFVIGSVTCLDLDKRTPKFFADTNGVREIIAQYGGPPEPRIVFTHADFTRRLDLPDEHFDLLV